MSSSLLLILLAVTGIFCHPSTSTAVGEEDCPKCKDTHDIRTADDLKRLCNDQPARETCYNNLPSSCKTTAFHNKVLAVNYMCQSSVKSRLSQQITACIQPNQATIDKKYNACMAKVPSGLTGSCKLDAIRKCVIKSLNDCCPSACADQDKYVYYFLKPTSVSSGCPWNLDSGYCQLSSSGCV